MDADSKEIDSLISLMEFVLNSGNSKQKLVPFEKGMLIVLIDWLKVIQNQIDLGEFRSELEFIEFYAENFYRKVFRSYDE